MRRPNLGAASADLAFAFAALVAGWCGATLLVAALIFVAAAVCWGWFRRASLGAMPAAQRFANGGIALGVLAIVLGGAYWLGLALGGHN